MVSRLEMIYSGRNSGAVVIKLDKLVFDQMVSLLPSILRYDVNHVYKDDGGYRDQEFVPAFFLNDTMMFEHTSSCHRRQQY